MQSANGCGPTGTEGAETRTVQMPVGGEATSTASSTFRLSRLPPVTETPPE